MHRSRRWYVFSDYPQIQFKRRCNVVSVGVAGLGLVLYCISQSDKAWVEDNTERFFQLMMACSTLRVLVLSDEFSSILLSILSGIQSLKIFVLLLLIIVYEFASFSHCAFKQDGWLGVEAPSHDQQGYWDSPIDSLITMYQLLVGEGWHEVMLWTEGYTYKIVWFYFVIYTMIVVILFSQLFIGIMIQMFQATEEKRQVGGDMYRLLGRLCPENMSMDKMNDIIYGLMNTRVPLDDFSDDAYSEILDQINKIQKAWRLKSNEKLFQKLQKEVHPVCALYNGKYTRTGKMANEISQYLALQIPVNGLLVKKELFKTDSWIEQHELLAILYKRFNYFTQWTKIRLQNGQSVFELTRFIAIQLRLVGSLNNMADQMLPDEMLEDTNDMNLFYDIVKHGDLTVLVKELKEIGIPLNGKGNRVIYDNELEDDRISTVEEDLYEYAQASVHWRPKFDVSLTAEEAKEQLETEHTEGVENDEAHSRLYEADEAEHIDMNAAQEEDAYRRAAWQQILEYATQAAQLDWWDKNPLYGSMETDPPIIRHRNYDTLLDPDFPPELREKIYQAVELLDNLARVVRLRAILARTNFGEAWNFVDFAHWFTEVFFTPISKIWL